MAKGCCEKEGLKKGTWNEEEDGKLIAYIQRHGHGNWHELPKQAGLLRCGKSCRFRWLNYLRPNIKRGDYSKEEEETIIRLHNFHGNRWATIAAALPGRTDNEIKNHWHSHLRKRTNVNQTKKETKQRLIDESHCSVNAKEFPPVNFHPNAPVDMLSEYPSYHQNPPQETKTNLSSGNGSSFAETRECNEMGVNQFVKSEILDELKNHLNFPNLLEEGFYEQEDCPSIFKDSGLRFPPSPLSYEQYNNPIPQYNHQMDFCCNISVDKERDYSSLIKDQGLQVPPSPLSCEVFVSTCSEWNNRKDFWCNISVDEEQDYPSKIKDSGLQFPTSPLSHVEFNCPNYQYDKEMDSWYISMDKEFPYII